jgi:WD40 repeat protein/DNA-binding winged helix-turn-helix (wHTH) protein
MNDETNLQISIGWLTVDPNHRRVFLGDDPIHLPPKEFDFLWCLVKRAGDCVKKDEILVEVWPDKFVEEARMNQLASLLRPKLGSSDSIVTVPGVGFYINCEFFRESANIAFLGPKECPWKGIAYYVEGDREIFFGRETKLREGVEKFYANGPVLTVMGPSGAGKTSLVRAGLIPLLLDGGVHDSKAWRYLVMRPGRTPISRLVRKLTELLESEWDAEEKIEQITNGIVNQTESVIAEWDKDLGGKLFFFVDKVEDLLTKDIHKAEAHKFIELILKLSKSRAIGAIVLCLQRSFYNAFCREFPNAASLITSNVLNVDDISRDELRKIIEGPANGRVSLEESLAEEIVDDVLADRRFGVGALPLLSNLMVELFEEAEGKRITLATYRSIGGIEKSIERHADRVFDLFNEEEQHLLKTMLVLFVDVGQTPEFDRCKQLSEDRLLSQFPKRVETVRDLFHRLIDAKFLVAGDEEENSYTFPHASIIRNWPKLQDLLNEQRDINRTAEMVRQRADNWLMNSRNPSELLRGSQLEMASELFPQFSSVIGDSEKEFLNRSIGAHKRSERIERVRRRVLYLILIGLFVGVVGVVGYLRLLNVNRAARNDAANAQVQLEDDPATALRLAIRAIENDESADTIAVLRAAVAGSHLRMTLKGHIASLMSIAASNDGRLLLTASRDNTAKIWDAATGAMLYTLSGHEGSVEWASFSSNGQYAATASADKTVRIWRTDDGSLVWKYESDGAFNNVVFSPDDSSLLTADENGDAIVWRFTPDDHSRVFKINHKGSTNPINSAVFNADGSLIATASGDKTAQIWDARTLSSKARLSHPDSVMNLAFSPDGEVLATACKDGVIRIWNVADGKLIREIKEHISAVNDVTFDPSGERIVSASMDATSMIFDRRTGKKLLTLKGHTLTLTSAVFSPDGRFVYTSDADTEARAWAVTNDLTPQEFGLTEGKINDASLSSDGQKLLTADAEGKVAIWNIESKKVMRILQHENSVVSSRFSPNQGLVAAATSDGGIYLWNILTNEAPRVLSVDGPSVVTFDPSGKLLAIGDSTGHVRLWSVGSMDPPVVFQPLDRKNPEKITGISFSSDGELVAASNSKRSVRIWNASTHDSLAMWNIGTGPVNGVIFDADDNLLASCSDKSVRVWNRKALKQVQSFFGHNEQVNRSTYDPSNDFIVSGSNDGSLRIWSIFFKKELYKLDSFSGLASCKGQPISSVAFNANGRDIFFTCGNVVNVTECPICALNNSDLLALAKFRLSSESVAPGNE